MMEDKKFNLLNRQYLPKDCPSFRSSLTINLPIKMIVDYLMVFQVKLVSESCI